MTAEFSAASGPHGPVDNARIFGPAGIGHQSNGPTSAAIICTQIGGGADFL